MLTQHLVQFSRALHAAGMPVGPSRVLAAISALEHIGIERRDDVRAALAAVMLDRREQRVLFDPLFDLMWGGGGFAPSSLALPAPDTASAEPPGANRLAQAIALARPSTRQSEPDSGDRSGEAHSADERLQRRDFATMTSDEFRRACWLAARIELPVEPVRRRRHEASAGRRPGARIDLRATLQRSARAPHTLIPVWSRPRIEPPALVVLLDISASMGPYARVLLHYIHGLIQRHHTVHALTFGTRLTNITRSLRERDPDMALAAAAREVTDWSGGTRIGACLNEFNRNWARRLLGGNAALLLVTDGLDRDPSARLNTEAARLARFAHQLVWLNPLLRFAGFEPRAAGVRALLPHVDRMLAVHNLASLADLGRALVDTRPARPIHRSSADGQPRPPGP
jgi:uncharacterized protein